MNNNLNLQGAVDLGALSAQRKAQEAALAAQAENPSVAVSIEVTADNFEQVVLLQSQIVPVILDFWADWCEPCKQLSPILEKLAREDAGQWVLAKVNIDVEQEIAAAFQIQSIPSLFAMIAGQPVPLPPGAHPEHQMRSIIDAVLAKAKEVGLPGRGQIISQADDVVEEVEEVEEPLDPGLIKAQDAIEEGNWDEAIAAYQELIKENPSDSLASIGLLNVELFKRLDDVDFDAAIAAAQTSVEAQLLAADCEFMLNEWASAFGRLISVVRNSSGDDRELAKVRLLDLFKIAGPHDASVIKARVDLSSALF